MTVKHVLSGVWVVVGLLAVDGCGGSDVSQVARGEAAGGNGSFEAGAEGAPNVDLDAGPDTGLDSGTPDGCGASCEAGAVCGDGALEGAEQCDDGNVTSGDGCNSTCKLEPGWACVTIKGKSVCHATVCGDGKKEGFERCDDGNATSGDGCSSTCKLEPGWACLTAKGKSACHKTTCGDGKKEGFEQCDDGNEIPYDGCSPTCTVEPSCANGQCTAVCGDGLKFPQEQCDDGNMQNGDGCSSTCKIEKGWTCKLVTQAPPKKLVIPILYRDFLYHGTTTPGPGHPDFQWHNGAAKGLVKSALGSDGKPVYNSSTGSGTTQLITNATSFCWWYHQSGCATGPNPYDKLVYTTNGQPNGPPTTLTLVQGAGNVYQYSNTAFFPIDGLGWGNAQVYNGHNFSFTSELRYQFTYQGTGTPAKFDFTGDDDVYVFINGKLAVDLGGVHGAENGSITLDAAGAAKLGLVAGGMYEIAVFQAERHTVASNYKLTLSNFVHAVSQCTTTCGDGIISNGEQCDNGSANQPVSKAYGVGTCTVSCKRAPWCGDGHVQAQFGEQCDGAPGCNGSCQWAIPK